MFITRGLLTALLEFAAEAEPDGFTAALSTTPAAELDGARGLPAESPVFTHFYLPDAGGSVAAVFGVDLSISPGRTDGRFASHPDGTLALRRSDELHATVLVAVPPWDRESVAAFDRSGRRRSVTVVDAEPAAEPLP